MPAAIDFATLAGISPRSDGKVVIYSENYSKERVFDAAALPSKASQHWSDYPLGVLAILAGEGHTIPGFSLSLWGDVPLGSGLSSSAAVGGGNRAGGHFTDWGHLSGPGACAALPAGGERVCRRQFGHHGSIHLRQRGQGQCAPARLPRPELPPGPDPPRAWPW